MTSLGSTRTERIDMDRCWVVLDTAPCRGHIAGPMVWSRDLFDQDGTGGTAHPIECKRWRGDRGSTNVGLRGPAEATIIHAASVIALRGFVATPRDRVWRCPPW
jgi:hypothetical protein